MQDDSRRRRRLRRPSARAGGKDFEVACLDPGGLGLDPAGRPAGAAPPPRCARASKAGRAVFANDLAKGAAERRPLPAARHAPESALVAPVVIAGEVAGLVGLLNKPGGFSAADSQLAEVFAEMAAVAMLNSRTVNGLEKDRNALEREVREGATHLREAEEKFRTLVENLPDVIARFDPDLRHLYVSPAVERVTGRPPQDFVGRTNRELGMSPELVERLGRSPAQGLRDRTAREARVRLSRPRTGRGTSTAGSFRSPGQAAPYRPC